MRKFSGSLEQILFATMSAFSKEYKDMVKSMAHQRALCNHGLFSMIGVDIIEIRRFKKLRPHQRTRLFTKNEIAYCSRFKDSATHFAGIFAAKEAASKALGTTRFPYLALEVRHTKNGAPQIWRSGRKIKMAISISHTAHIAIASAIRT